MSLDLNQLETRLWAAADQLWANTGLKPSFECGRRNFTTQGNTFAKLHNMAEALHDLAFFILPFGNQQVKTV